MYLSDNEAYLLENIYLMKEYVNMKTKIKLILLILVVVVLPVIFLTGCTEKEVKCTNIQCNKGEVRTIVSQENCNICTTSTCDASGTKCACGSSACFNAKISGYGRKTCETCNGTGYIKSK